MKQAILLLVHNFDYSTQQNVDAFLKLIDDNTDFFLLFHKKDELPRIDSSYDKYVFDFSSDIIYEMGYRPFGDGIVVGNGHFPVLRFYLSHNHYDYYWIIEGDVFFNGLWKYFFKSFSLDMSDMLSSYVTYYHEDREWPWWDSLRVKGETIGKSDYVRSLNPIYRLSNRALDVIHKCLLLGWEGHYEVLLASILHHYGLAVKDINENETFYTRDTFSYLPLSVPVVEANMLYHPIKIKSAPSTHRKNCVISVVGRNSLHKKWSTCENRTYDIHLIICDNCFNSYYNDADFLYYGKGEKMKLVHDYLYMFPQYLEWYDYFFLPDDDIFTSQETIEDLFNAMAMYKLQIAQPSLKSSFFTYPHTLQEHHSRVRYVNFVEMMIPCFSKKTLKKVLDSFSSQDFDLETTDYLAKLIGSNHKDMAILDEVSMVHVKPANNMSIGFQKFISSSNSGIEEYGYIANDDYDLSVEDLALIHRQRKKIIEALFAVADIIKDRCDAHIISREGLDGLLNAALFFKEVYCISEAVVYKKYSDYYKKRVVPHLEAPFSKQSFISGELGKVWALWHLDDRTGKSEELFPSIEDLKVSSGKYEDIDFLGFSWEEMFLTSPYIVMKNLSQKLSEEQSSGRHDLFCYAWNLVSMLKSLYTS